MPSSPRFVSISPKTLWITALSALASFLLVAIGWEGYRFWDAHFSRPRLPDEARLRQVFNTKREVFEQVRRMTLADQAHYFGVNSNGSGSFGLPVERLHAYQMLLDSMGRGVALWPGEAGKAKFAFEGASLSAIAPHWANGIECIPGDPAREGRVIKRLGEIDLKAEGEIYLLPLGDGWYIFHEDY